MANTPLRKVGLVTRLRSFVNELGRTGDRMYGLDARFRTKNQPRSSHGARAEADEQQVSRGT